MSVKIGLLGAGDFGQLHARVLADLALADLVVVADPDGARASRVADAVGSAWTTDVDDVLDRTDLEAVVIASPENAHVPQVRQALKQGKHVFVEKPVALAATAIPDLIALARERNKVLMPGHVLRFAAPYVKVREWLAHQQPARVHSIFARRNVPRVRFAEHQRTHTALMSLIHDIDLMLWYLPDQSPVRAYAVERRTVPGPGHPDIFWGLIEFSGGTVACVESLWTLPDGGGRYVDVELELSTSSGYLTVTNPGDAVKIVDDKKTNQLDTMLMLEYGSRKRGALYEELRHFLAQILDSGVRPLVTAGDAFHATRVAEALIRSARKGAPVAIDSVNLSE